MAKLKPWDKKPHIFKRDGVWHVRTRTYSISWIYLRRMLAATEFCDRRNRRNGNRQGYQMINLKNSLATDPLCLRWQQPDISLLEK